MSQGILPGFITYLEVKYHDQTGYKKLNWELSERSILWIKDVCIYTHIHIYTHIYYGILHNYRNEWSNAIYHNKDGPGDDHTQWSDSDHTQTEKDKSHTISLIGGSYEMIQMNLFTKQKTNLMITKGERWGKG